jgi:hypothetical protein
MEKSKLTETKKSETDEEQSQEHAHHFDIKVIAHKEFVHTTVTFYSNCTKMCEDATKELVVASQQRTISHFPFHQYIFFKNNMTVIPHLLYMTPCNISLIPYLKIKL